MRPATHLVPLEAITSIRFVASFHIVLFHLAMFWDLGEGQATGVLRIVMIAAPTWMTYFFVVSGFVITYVYGRSGPLADRRTFLMARFLRLFPLHLITLVIMALVGLGLGMRVDLVTALAHATLTHAWFPDWVWAFNVPTWTLSVELFCYLAFAFVLMPALARVSRGTLVALAITAWLLLLASSGLYAFFDPYGSGLSGPADEQGHFWWGFLMRAPPVHLAEFLIGVCVAKLHVATPRTSQPTGLLLLATGALGLPVVLFAPLMLRQTGAAVPAVVAFLWACTDVDHRVVRLLSWRPLVALGDASLELYVLHFPLLFLAQGIKPSLVAGALISCGCVILSVVVHYGFQRRVQRWGRRRRERADPGPADTKVAPRGP